MRVESKISGSSWLLVTGGDSYAPLPKSSVLGVIQYARPRRTLKASCHARGRSSVMVLESLTPFESTGHEPPRGTTHWDLKLLQRCHDASRRSSVSGETRHAAPARMTSGYAWSRSTSLVPSAPSAPGVNLKVPASRICPKLGWLVYEAPRRRRPSLVASQ